MIVIIVMVLYNLADTFFIGQMGDPEKIAAISVCMPVFTVLSGIGTLFGIGGGTAVSIALGEKNRQQIGEITAFCYMGTLLVGTVYGIFNGAVRRTIMQDPGRGGKLSCRCGEIS